MAIVLIVGVAVFFAGRWQPGRSIPMPDKSQVELSLEHEGTTYKLVNGDLYRVTAPDQLVFVEKLYDTNFRTTNYAQKDGLIVRVDSDTGKMYPTRRHFEEGFENAERITDLIGPDRGWTTFTLQSVKTPTIREYNQLRGRILRGECDFADNRVQPTLKMAHSGIRSLECYSVAPSPKMVCAKASLSTELLYFVKGDDVWFSGWYFIPEGEVPFTLMDLESTWIKEHPGMRIMIEDGAAMFELKWANKPKYRQPKATRVPIPAGRWVNFKACLHLSEAIDGRVELWQDGVKLIDEHGQTLPLASAVYDSMEIGISAHSFGPNAATIYVDDVTISDKDR